jgi:hypothetical protein
MDGKFAASKHPPLQAGVLGGALPRGSQLTDNLAIVTMLITQKATFVGRDRSGDFYIVDVWKKTGDNWQMIARYSTPDRSPVH